jgi:hypothetical protein
MMTNNPCYKHNYEHGHNPEDEHSYENGQNPEYQHNNEHNHYGQAHELDQMGQNNHNHNDDDTIDNSESDDMIKDEDIHEVTSSELV